MKFSLLLALFLNTLFASAEEFVFDELSDTEFHRAMQKVIETAYKSLDINVTYQHHPLLRSYKEAELGRLSGLMGRVADRDGKLDNLIMIEEPIGGFNIVLVINRALCSDCTLDTAKYVGTVSGFEGLRYFLSKNQIERPLTVVPLRKTLFEMMEKDRFEAIIVSDVLIPKELLLEHPEWEVQVLTSEYMYHYLHISEAQLVPAISEAIVKAKTNLNAHLHTLNISVIKMTGMSQ